MRPIAFVDPGAFTVTDLVKLPTTRFLDNLWGGGLADRLLLRITYGMAILRQLRSFDLQCGVGSRLLLWQDLRTPGLLLRAGDSGSHKFKPLLRPLLLAA
jgi:hypothetical protein